MGLLLIGLQAAQAAADARSSASAHSISYVDFLTVTLTAMCVLLAALGFIVALLALVGYRDIKAAARRAGQSAVEAAIESKLREYPEAAEIHDRYQAMNRYMEDMLRTEALLSQTRATSPDPAGKRKLSPPKNPRRYPKKTE